MAIIMHSIRTLFSLTDCHMDEPRCQQFLSDVAEQALCRDLTNIPGTYTPGISRIERGSLTWRKRYSGGNEGQGGCDGELYVLRRER
jgi:hypothetical protein